jgi:putative ATPase
MTDLFATNKAAQNVPDTSRPLADRLRPQTLDDIAGQDHLLGPEGPLRRMLGGGALASIILWGPPGCGKTTLARIIAGHADMQFEQLSAIFSGVADLRKIFDAAKLRAQNGRRTLLFVDEIHRFSKSQQDAFLPVMEDGTITLIGATTENPSFELNAALLSRAQVFVLRRLDDAALERLLQRAEKETGQHLPLEPEARERLKAMADGDGRYLLTMAEQVLHAPHILSPEDLSSLLQKRAPLYDKGDDSHYNLISALHKSVRGSDVDAALYWFARMLDGGEDPHYVARRLTRMAVEDIGLADPQALNVCMNAWQAFERQGSPEGELALAQALIYLATAPKSNAVYTAYKAARRAASETGSLMPPKHILNAPTKMMRDQGYGDGYAYDHDTENRFSGQNYFPDGMPRAEFYKPVEVGFEREIQKRLDYWAKLRNEKGAE